MLIGGCLSLASGCSAIAQSDRPTATAHQDQIQQFVALGPLPYQETSSYYSTHCDEQTREQQHELANCTSVPFVNILLAPPPHS